MRKEKAMDRQGFSVTSRTAVRDEAVVDPPIRPDGPGLAPGSRPCACSGVNFRGMIIVGLTLLAVSLVSQGLGREEEDVPAFDNYLIIPERNMFSSSRRPSGAAQRTERKPHIAAASLPEGLEVIGIVKTSDPFSSIVVIKDHGRHVPCRVGDRIGDMVITDIRTSEIFFESPEGTRIARIQPGVLSDRTRLPQPRKAVPQPVRPPVAVASSAGQRVPIRAVEIRHLAKELPLVTCVEDGRVRGLELTQDIMGLREGDRVTHVAGQSLNTRHPKQKLLQITRKYRQYGRGMPEIPVVIERDDRQLKLVLVPFS